MGLYFLTFIHYFSLNIWQLFYQIKNLRFVLKPVLEIADQAGGERAFESVCETIIPS